MSLTIGKKLATGIGILLLLIAAIGLLAMIYVRGVHGSLGEIVQVHQPVIRATLGVEVDVGGLGSALYGYLKERDPQHLDRLKVRETDLEKGVTALLDLPLSEEERRLVGELKAHCDEITGIIGQVLADFEQREVAMARLTGAQRTLDGLIDDRMEAPVADGLGVDAAKLRAAMELEINVNGVGKAIGQFQDTADPRYERDFETDVTDVRAALAAYEALLSEPERTVAREFSAEFDSLAADARVVIDKEKAVRAQLRAFTKLRRDLQYGTVTDLRKLAERAYDAAKREAVRTVQASTWTLSLGIVLAAIIGLAAGFVVSRSVTRPVNEVVGRLASVSSEIVAATAEQTAGAAEQASAVSQTVSNIEEMRQTSEQAAERAQQMMDKARESEASSERGNAALQDAVTSMRRVEEQSSAVAGHIVALAERTQAIGEIIAAVTEIAEQSNLLALNAAIEASRAGEHGRGFAVVATEIKALAERSKKGTTQVRQILGDIQKATNAAVLSTEESSRSVNATIAVVSQAGEVLNALAHAIEDTATISAQAAASARQQATGVVQVQQAMAAIDQVAKQSLVATRQVSASAHELGSMSDVLRTMVASRKAQPTVDERG